MVRREGWAHLSKGVGKAVSNRKPRGLGRRGRVSNLQQQPRAAAAAQQPQRQLHKKILGVLGRRAAQGTDTWSWNPNLVLGKVVPVVWCEGGEVGRARRCPHGHQHGQRSRAVAGMLGEFYNPVNTFLERIRIFSCTFLLYSLHQFAPTAIVGGNARPSARLFQEHATYRYEIHHTTTDTNLLLT